MGNIEAIELGHALALLQRAAKIAVVLAHDAELWKGQVGSRSTISLV